MPALFVPDVPTCGPRVKPEADEYYQRNRGSMFNYLDHTRNKNFISPRPVPRTGGNPETIEQLEKHRGSMNLLMDQKLNKSYCSPRRQPRCNTPEAQFQYERAKGCMNEVMSGYGGRDPRNRGSIHPRAVMPEASQIATMNKGLATKKLFDTYGLVTPKALPMARVKPEAEDNAANNKGNATKTLFYSYGKLSDPCPKPSLGITEEAQENANLDRGGRAKKLLSMNPPTIR